MDARELQPLQEVVNIAQMATAVRGDWVTEAGGGRVGRLRAAPGMRYDGANEREVAGPENEAGAAESSRVKFTKVSSRLQVSEDGAQVTTRVGKTYPVVGSHKDSHKGCHTLALSGSMQSGQHWVEFQVSGSNDAHIGVARSSVQVEKPGYEQAEFWGVGLYGKGGLYNNSGTDCEYDGCQSFERSELPGLIGMCLDSNLGTLTVYKNGTKLGIAVTAGLTGEFCWAYSPDAIGASVRVERCGVGEFGSTIRVAGPEAARTEALRAEAAALPMRALRARAEAHGASAGQLAAAVDNDDDPKEALVKLVLALAPLASPAPRVAEVRWADMSTGEVGVASLVAVPGGCVTLGGAQRAAADAGGTYVAACGWTRGIFKRHAKVKLDMFTGHKLQFDAGGRAADAAQPTVAVRGQRVTFEPTGQTLSDEFGGIQPVWSPATVAFGDDGQLITSHRPETTYKVEGLTVLAADGAIMSFSSPDVAVGTHFFAMEYDPPCEFKVVAVAIKL
jgi:hypothetical protein